MKWENRKSLRDALVGRQILDVVFHDSHGLIIDLKLDDGSKLSVATYEEEEKALGGNFYVGINDQEF